MSRSPVLLLLTVVLLGPCTAARAEESPSAERLLARAIDAHGGRAALAAWPSLERKGSYENPSRQGGRSPIVLRERADGAYRRELTFEWRGRTLTPVTFYDGRVVKRRFGRGWDDLPTAEAEEQAAHRLPWLLQLEPDEARLEGEGRVGDIATWTLSVPDGRERAVLQLAQDDGRLVGLAYPGTSASGMGTKEEVTRELVFRDHRDVKGLSLPFDVEVSEKGSPVARYRWDSVRVLESFDDEWLKVPDPSRRFIPGEELAF